MAAEGRFFCWEKLSILYLQKNNQQSRKKEKDMERTTKKALGTMIGEMLQVEGLSGRQMYIIDVLCKINESREIASNTEYYYDDIVDKFEDFVVENDIEIWDAFNACNGQIDKLVLLNTKKLDEEEDIEQESRIIVDFKYDNGVAQFCYVRIVYATKNKEGNIVKSMFNWNDEVDACTFNFNEVELHDKKSDLFIKIPLN